MSKEKYIPKSLDETYVPPKDDGLKMKPYDRLQSIFAEIDSKEGKLTTEGQEKLDFLLGVQKEPNVLSKGLSWLKELFQKLDNLIFRKPSRSFNTTYHKRK